MAPVVICGPTLITSLKFPLVFSENNNERNLYQCDRCACCSISCISQGQEIFQLQAVFSGLWSLVLIVRRAEN